MTEPPFRKGRLLVAAPALVDPNFRRSVVLMLEHSPDGGALGLVLNRADAARAGPGGAPRGDSPRCCPERAVVHEGGPGAARGGDRAGRLQRRRRRAATIAFGSVGIVGSATDGAELERRVRAIRAFGGYAGWAGGQLEQEIEEEAWIDAAARRDDVFTDDPNGLWSRVLERKGGAYRLIARMPEDPSAELSGAAAGDAAPSGRGVVTTRAGRSRGASRASAATGSRPGGCARG